MFVMGKKRRTEYSTEWVGEVTKGERALALGILI
jgi:hypothetical protein